MEISLVDLLLKFKAPGLGDGRVAGGKCEFLFAVLPFQLDGDGDSGGGLLLSEQRNTGICW